MVIEVGVVITSGDEEGIVGGEGQGQRFLTKYNDLSLILGNL